MDNRLSILIQAILSKTTESEFEAELKKIEQKLKPVKVTATLDDKQLDKFTKKFETLAGEHEKLTQEVREYTDTLGKTHKVIDDIDKETQSVYKSTELITDNYKKQRQEAEKLQKAQSDKVYKQIEATIKNIYSIKSKLVGLEEGAEKQALESNLKLEEMRFAKMNQRKVDTNLMDHQKEIELIKLQGDLQGKLNVLKGQQFDKQAYAAEAKAQQEYVNSMMAQIRAIEQRNKKEAELTSILQNNSKQLDLFKQKMLGGKGFLGELDIASQKYGKSIDGNALKEIRRDINNLTAETPDLQNKIQQLSIKFSSLKQSASQSGTVMGRMFENMVKFMRFYLVGGILVGFIRELKDAVGGVIELDKSLTELNKVADLTNSQLQNITKNAFEAGKTIGRTGKEVIDATTEFKRAGYSIEEAFDLSQQALLLTNIGDGINDVKEASSSIIAVLKGFKMEANETMHVIDALNEVSNNFAVDTNNLTEIMKRVSGTIAQTGTSYEQLLGLATGGFESLRNAEMVASGINMISQRKTLNNNAKLLGVASYVQKCA